MSEQADSQPQESAAAPAQAVPVIPEPAPASEQVQATPPESTQPDLSALMARMDELAQRIPTPPPVTQEEGGRLEDLAYQQQQAPEDEYEPYDETTDNTDHVAQFIQEQVNQAVRAQVDPMRIQAQAQQLEQKYPDLQKPEIAGPLVKKAAQEAQRLGFSMGLSPEHVDRLARDPSWVEKMYLADLASQRAAQETPAEAENGAHIEGSGAQVEQPEVSVQDRIINAGGNKPNGIW